MIEPNPLRELKNTLGQILIAGVFFWFAAQGQAANNRMAANPHASAAIEGTWTRPGKRGGRFADLYYSNTGGSRALWCHAHGVRIGPDSLPAHIGQRVEIVPVPDSCAAPDVPSEAMPCLAVLAFYAVSFITGAFGLMSAVGVPLFPRRLHG